MVVRCTARLLDQIRVSHVCDAPANDDDWYANLLWIDRRKCLLLMHAGTLFPVFAPDVRRRDLRRLGPYVVALIETALADEQLPADALGALDANAVAVAKTASRSILGFMNDSAELCRHHVHAAGGLADLDVAALNHRLRRSLHNRDGYHDALSLVSRGRDGQVADRDGTEGHSMTGSEFPTSSQTAEINCRNGNSRASDLAF